MEPGGYDFVLEFPTTPSTIQQWWSQRWPQAYVEDVDEDEVFIWRTREASEVEDGTEAYEMVHVIVEPTGVTLIVDEPEIPTAKACLSFLFQDWN